MCAWDWATMLTIAGAVLEVAGLGFVFAELALIRSDEFGEVPPWVKLRLRLLRLFIRQHPKTAYGSAQGSGGGSVTAHGYGRPGRLTEEMTDRDRIERLESYVEFIDRDLLHVRDFAREQAAEADANAARRDAELKTEIERRETARQGLLKPSLRRQALGGLCVLLGIVLGTIGNVI